MWKEGLFRQYCLVVAAMTRQSAAVRWKKRIAAGSGEKMRKVGSKGAPTADAFKQAAKTRMRRKG